jgi:UDP-glucose 4-epimerase
LKILLTGAAGYLGSESFQLLCDAGHDVVGTDLRSLARAPAGAAFELADLTDESRVLELVRETAPDAIVHLAGLLSARESMDQPERYLRANVIGSLNVIEGMLSTPCRRLVFASTNSVYGNPARSPVLEDDPLEPHTLYGESKIIVERMLRWFAERKGLSWAALRFFNLAGGNEFQRMSSSWSGALSTRLLAVALGKVPQMDIFGTDHPTPDGTCVRDYLHVHDAALAVVAAVERRAEGTFNISGGHAVSIADAVDAYRRASGQEITVVDKGHRAGDVAEIIADISKAEREMGWRPVHSSIDEIAASAWASARTER